MFRLVKKIGVVRLTTTTSISRIRAGPARSDEQPQPEQEPVARSSAADAGRGSGCSTDSDISSIVPPTSTSLGGHAGPSGKAYSPSDDGQHLDAVAGRGGTR